MFDAEYIRGITHDVPSKEIKSVESTVKKWIVEAAEGGGFSTIVSYLPFNKHKRLAYIQYVKPMLIEKGFKCYNVGGIEYIDWSEGEEEKWERTQI